MGRCGSTAWSLTADFHRLAPHPHGTYSVKSEVKRPLNKPTNYIITNCDACGLVTGALSENGNAFKVGEGSDMQDQRWRWRRSRKATCVQRIYRQRKVCQPGLGGYVKATGKTVEVIPHFRTHDPTFMASEYLENLIIFYFHLPPISNTTEWGVNYWISFKNYLILAIIYVTRVNLSWGHLQTDPFMPHSQFWWISSLCAFSVPKNTGKDCFSPSPISALTILP